MLIMKIRKLKKSQKMEQANEDMEVKLLETKKQNRHLTNYNQELIEQIKI